MKMETLIFWLWAPFVIGIVGLLGLYITRRDRRPHDPAE